MHKLLITSVAASLPGIAFAFNLMTPAHILKVRPISDTNFEVLDGPFSGPRAYWCAAARYVENTLGRQQSRIYLAKGRGPSQTTPGKMAVQFSITPTGEDVASYSVSITKVGYNLGSGHALRFCDDYYTTDQDF